MALAARANRLLEDPLFTEAFETVREHFKIQWENSESNQTEFRDLCWRSMKAADLFKQVFTKYVESGKLAEKQLEQIKKHKDGFIGGQADPYGSIA